MGTPSSKEHKVFGKMNNLDLEVVKTCIEKIESLNSSAQLAGMKCLPTVEALSLSKSEKSR